MQGLFYISFFNSKNKLIKNISIDLFLISLIYISKQILRNDLFEFSDFIKFLMAGFIIENFLIGLFYFTLDYKFTKQKENELKADPFNLVRRLDVEKNKISKWTLASRIIFFIGLIATVYLKK